MTTALPSRLALRAPGLALLGAAGAGLTALAFLAPRLPGGDLLSIQPASQVLLAASAAALATAIAFSTSRLSWEALAAAFGALGGQALLAGVRDPAAVPALLLLVAFAAAARPGLRPFGLRVRGPALSALLLGVGWSFVQSPGQAWMGRVGALCLALGLAAAAGLLPYLVDLVPEEAPSASYLSWTAFFAPALALALPIRLLAGLTTDEAAVFAAALIGLGLLNVGWGAVCAWLTASDTAAWRYSFVADWGLALVGLGLLTQEGMAAAYLALLAVVLVRLPLALWARPVLVYGEQPSLGPVNLLITALLAGAAPFSGFPVRLLLLQAATQVAWPLALALLAAMLLWVAHAFRLARTLGRPRGRLAAGLGLTMAFSLALGVLPGALQAMGEV